MSLIKHRRKKFSNYNYNLETIRKSCNISCILLILVYLNINPAVSSPSLFLEHELVDLDEPSSSKSETQILIGKEVPISASNNNLNIASSSVENCTQIDTKCGKQRNNKLVANATKDPLSFDHILRSIFSEEVLNDNDEDMSMEDDQDHDHDEPNNNDDDDQEHENPRAKSLFPLSRGRSIGRRDSESESFENRRSRPIAKNKPKPNQFNKRRVGVNNKNDKNKRGQSSPNKRNNNNNKNGSNSKPKGKIDLSKYNAYMDAVLKKMNSLIRKKRMDPLRVNLYAGPSNANKKGNNKKKTSPRSFQAEIETIPIDPEGDDEQEGNARKATGMVMDDAQVTRDVFVEQRSMRALQMNDTNNMNKVDKEIKSDEGRAKNKEKQNTESQSSKSKETVEAKDKKTSSNSKEKEKDSSNEEARKKDQNSPRPTRGILHGLSTLRRDGNVMVIKDGERARIVRSRFLLGPVGLEIMPRKRKGSSSSASREDKPSPAITANAPQLKGILEIRLTQNKPTRIRKLRVFPPGKVEVDRDQNKSSSSSSSEINLDAKRSGGMGYRKVTPMATARLRQAAVQVVRQVDNKMKQQQSAKTKNNNKRS